MRYTIVQNSESRSFPIGDSFLAGASAGDSAQGEVLVILGDSASVAAGLVSSLPLERDSARTAILVELGTECLGVHTGEASGHEGSNVLGFARYRNGDDPPSSLVELVRQPKTDPAAIDAAKALFEGAGLTVVVCADQAGRIIDRLVRPKYNAALRFLDEGLASAEAMDLTCRLGLNYPDGPIERVERGGLASHYDVTQALFETYGMPGFAPARRAVVAARRRELERVGRS